MEEMFDHLQIRAEGLVATLDHPVIGRYRAMTKPIKFADTPGLRRASRRPPASTAMKSSPGTAIRLQRSWLCASAALCGDGVGFEKQICLHRLGPP
jgi:hypothetical protein